VAAATRMRRRADMSPPSFTRPLPPSLPSLPPPRQVFESQRVDPSILSDLVTTGRRIRAGADGMWTVTGTMSVRTQCPFAGKHRSQACDRHVTVTAVIDCLCTFISLTAKAFHTRYETVPSNCCRRTLCKAFFLFSFRRIDSHKQSRTCGYEPGQLDRLLRYASGCSCYGVCQRA
jgi:hypothetical protein